MKVRKIRNVPKDECVAEQKIAYNIAFRIHINHGNQIRAAELAMHKNDLLVQARDLYLKEFQRDYNQKNRYNIDAIFVALNQGLRDYIEKPFIASDYKQIGECFKIPYEIA